MFFRRYPHSFNDCMPVAALHGIAASVLPRVCRIPNPGPLWPWVFKELELSWAPGINREEVAARPQCLAHSPVPAASPCTSVALQEGVKEC